MNTKKIVGICAVLLVVVVPLIWQPWVAPVAPVVEEPAVPAEELHEIYQLLPKVSLAGVLDPRLPDRTDIPKAWPKTPADPERINIGWSKITLGNPWFVDVKNKAQETADEYGFEITFLSAEGDVAKQSADIDTLIAKGVDIIVVDPIEPLAVARDIQRAVDAGIPVLAVGAVPDPSAPVLTTIVFNSYELGFMAGEYIVEQFGPDEEINAALIIGMMGSSASESRLCGVIGGIVAGRQKQMNTFTIKEDAMLKGYHLFEELKNAGNFSVPELNFHVLSWGTGHWTEEGGLAAAEDILTAVGDQINIIIPDNDFMGMGALRAIDAIGKKGQIQVACPADGNRHALGLVKTGEMMFSAAYSGGQVGNGAVEFIKQIFIDGEDPNNLPLATFFPPFLITIDNVHEVYDPDVNNPFYKVPPFEFPMSIPELREYLEQMQ